LPVCVNKVDWFLPRCFRPEVRILHFADRNSKQISAILANASLRVMQMGLELLHFASFLTCISYWEQLQNTKSVKEFANKKLLKETRYHTVYFVCRTR
jgi:hypothetical protein